MFVKYLCRFVLISIATLHGTLVFAQKDKKLKEEELDSALQKKLEQLQDAGDESIDLQHLSSLLSEYVKHPLDLNTASREQLQELSMLDALQIKTLLDHIERNGKLLCLEELQSIDGFDLFAIHAILPFVCVRNSSPIKGALPAEIKPYIRHSFLLRYSRTIQQQDGYSGKSDTVLPVYLGSPDRLLARYRFAIRSNVSAGVLLEKDAGEPSAPPDFVSAYGFLKSEGWLRRIALGDYRLSYGQGLVCWSGFSGGKSAEMMSIRKNADGIRPYTSTDENAALRGAAVALGKGPVQLDAFASCRKVDAYGIDFDSINERTRAVSALQTSGYHRSISEMQDKQVLEVRHLGGHLGLASRPFQAGVTCIKTDFSANLMAGDQPYERYAPMGASWINTSVDYSLFIRNFTFFGEYACMPNGAAAMVNGLLIALHPRFSLSVLQRDYKRNYVAFNARGAGEASDTRNEQGLLLGWTWKCNDAWTLSGYYDHYRFPWLKYAVPAPSQGTDRLLQLAYVPSKKTSLDLRYRLEAKEESMLKTEPAVPGLQESSLQHLRFQVAQQLSSSFQVRSRMDYTTKSVAEDALHGFLITQDIVFKPLSGPLSLNARYALFQVDDYDARIYVYENDVLYSYSMNAFYGRGIRWYANVRLRLRRGLDVWLNYSSTLYTDRREISSGPDRIQGWRRSDVAFQGRWEF